MKTEQDVMKTQLKYNRKDIEDQIKRRAILENDLTNIKLQIGYDDEEGQIARLAKD